MNIDSLARLLQLASPSLPVGGYAYSQGLEWAIDADWVCTVEQCHKWIEEAVKYNLCLTELPILSRMFDACEANDLEAMAKWSEWVLASRESKERFQEDQWLASAYRKVMVAIDVPLGSLENLPEQHSYLCYIAIAASHFSIEKEALLGAYLWQFIENQALGAMKMIPLGQTDGLKMAHQLSANIGAWVQRGLSVREEDIGASLPGWIMASMLHETQYSRLYRS